MTDLRHLLEQLRRGERPPLSVDDVELLLGWLTGSAAREGSEGADLPSPGHDPVLLQMVLHRLDDVLFDGGELRPAAAGLDASEPATRRRIRFRRLASAFHPDRFPDLADWLTQRSQAVHRAYARFKQDPDAPVAAPSPARPHPPPHGAGPRRQDMRRAAPRVRKHRIRAFANRLRARFGNDRYLAHKLIGGLALLALLPVLNMVLVPAKDPVDGLRSTVEQEETGSGFRVPGSGENQDGGAASSEPGFVGAVSGRDRSAQDAPPTTSELDSQSLAKQAPTSVASSGAGEHPQTGRDPSTSVGAGLAGDDVPADAGKDSVGAASSRDDRNPESRIVSAHAETAETDRPARKPETGNPKPAPSAPSAQDAPPTASQPANKETSQPANQPTGEPAPQAQSDLALGLLATHPAGEVLKRLHAALVAGNIPGIAGSFAPDARMASLRGRDAIADHFRAGFDSADSRQVNLKVLRLGREDDGWRVEADLDVRVRRDASTHALVTGRSSFLLVERGDRMLIDRMELE